MPKPTRSRLAKRVLTPGEHQHYDTIALKSPDNAIRYLVKRWAAKEAAAKALGTGIAKGVSFQHIEIKNRESGQPTLTFSGQALVIAQTINANNWHISIADERLYATAFVTLSSK